MEKGEPLNPKPIEKTPEKKGGGGDGPAPVAPTATTEAEEKKSNGAQTPVGTGGTGV